jgi:prohibitin 2
MKPRQIVLCVLGFLFTLFLFGCFTIVPPGHRGVRVTLGSTASEALTEGINFKWPMISSIELFTTQQGTTASKAECFSKDLQMVDMSFAVMSRISEGRVVELYQKFHGDVYQTLIEPRAQESLKQITAQYNAEELVQKRDEVRHKALDVLRKAVGEYAVIADLNIVNVTLSKELEHAIEAKMVRQQESLAKRFELEKEQMQAQITVVQAKAEAESVKIKGEAITTNPMVIQLEIAKKWDGKSPTTLVTGGASGASVVFPVGQQTSK